MGPRGEGALGREDVKGGGARLGDGEGGGEGGGTWLGDSEGGEGGGEGDGEHGGQQVRSMRQGRD